MAKVNKNDLDEFSRLVANLEDGTLSLTKMKIAYEEYIRHRKDFSDSVKDLLTNKKSGIIHKQFMMISHIVGVLELADLRAKQGDTSL